MKQKRLPLLLSLLPFACLQLSAQVAGVLNEGVQLTHDSSTALTESFTVSWPGEAGRFYGVATSYDLSTWDLTPGSWQEGFDGPMGMGFETGDDRLFFRLEIDNGIRLTARCEPEVGAVIEIDISRWREKAQPLSVASFTLERSENIDGPFDGFMTVSNPFYSLGQDNRMEVVDRTAVVGSTYYYRLRFNYHDGSTNADAPPSNITSVTATCTPSPGPTLTASCRSDRIVLEWLRPEWATPENGADPMKWTIKRATDPDGLYSELPLGSSNNQGWSGGIFVDAAVVPGTTYYYTAEFIYIDHHDAYSRYPSPKSDVIAASTCSQPPPSVGPMDVVFIIDNTQSDVSNAVEELKKQAVIDAVLDGIDTASNGDYRLALLTPDSDIVHVRLNFAPGNRADFKSTLLNLPPPINGVRAPESTDECLNTVVNALSATDRIAPPEEQIGDFDPSFENDEFGEPRQAEKIVVIITDNPPAGFDNPEIWKYDPHGIRAHGYAVEARDEGISINAIMVGAESVERQSTIDYAETTCGWFSELNSDGKWIEEAILNIVHEPSPYCEP